MIVFVTLIFAKKKRAEIILLLLILKLVKTPTWLCNKHVNGKNIYPVFKWKRRLRIIHCKFPGFYHCMHKLSCTLSWLTQVFKRMLWILVERLSPGSLPINGTQVPWGGHECDNKQTKKLILPLKFAWNTDLGPKHLVAWSVNDINFVLSAKIAKSANYATSGFLGMKIMFVMTNYANDYASTIYYINPIKTRFLIRPMLKTF